MKTTLFDIGGKKVKDIEVPKCFEIKKIREDIVAKVIEAKKIKQPYAPSPVAGNQASASGKLKHHRHVWKSQYGRGMSRIPRKSLSRRGSQFNWVGATVPNTRGGRRAHPPKILGMINTKKINKKEMKIALCSAISATANKKVLAEKYKRIEEKQLTNLPFVVESKISSLKIKDLLSSIKKILGKELMEVAVRTKKVRAGKGKLRGRKYKSNAGLLIVIGNKEKLKTNAFEVTTANKLSVNDLARGGVGRLVLYTDSAIKELGERL